MNTTRKAAILLFIVILYQGLWGQEIQSEFPKITPPEVYNFIRYGDVPINESCGTVGLSVPIYTIKQDEFEFPLHLTYHSGGHRVTDEASWVGLGWDLQIGSVVQMVQGENDLEFPCYLPDYHASILTSSMTEAIAVTGSQPVATPYYGFYDFWDYKYPKNGSGEDWENRLNSGSPISDLEPDIFVANFNGHSLQFLIDPNNTSNYVVLNKKGYKVRRSPSNGWIITTSQGIQYYFDEINQTQANSFTSGKVAYSQAFPNADFSSNITIGGSPKLYDSETWQLSKIITKVGREINFRYSEKEALSNKMLSYQWDLSKVTSVVSEENEAGPLDFLGSSFPRGDSPVGQVSYSSEATSTEMSYVSSIEFNDGNSKLNFELLNRSDINNAKELQSITLQNGQSTIKTFNFTYNYFVSAYSGRGYVSTKTQTELTHRLKLESFSESGKPAYHFIYNSTTLPAKNSFAQDYWGFYNGMLQNNSILPNVNRLKYSPDININLPEYFQSSIDYNTTNNSADLTYAKASILEKIVYPTGGETNFEYELNTYSNQILPDKDYKEIEISEQINLTSSNLGNDINQNRAGFYTPDPNVTCSGHVTLHSYVNTCDLNNIYARIYSLNISAKNDYDSDNTGFWVKFNANVYPKELVFERTLEMSSDNIIVPVNDDFSLSISPSKFYVAIVKADLACEGYPSNQAGMQINLNGSYLPPFTQTETKGNGLRISSITNYSNDEFVNKKNYTYSEGKVQTPRLFYKNWQYSDSYDHNSYGYNVFQFKTSSFIEASAIDAGNGVCYGKVIIEDVDKQNISNGRIERYFTNISNEYPAASPLKYMWGLSLPTFRTGLDNGLLLKEIIFNSENDTLSQTEYEYLNKTYDKFYGVRYKFLGIIWNSVGYELHTWGYHPNGMFSFYPILKTEALLRKKTTTSKLDGQHVIVEENITYTDDNLVRNQKTKNSDGSETGTTYFYPEDVSIIDELTETERTVINQLNKNNQHRIGEIIKTQTYTGLNTTKEVIRTYNNFSGLTLPSSIQVSYKDNQYKKEAIFDNYDEKGNLIKYHKENDISTFLIWGYNKLYPVAQIQTSDATFDQSSIQTCVNGLNLSNKDDLENINNDIGELKNCLGTLPGNQDYMVSYYTYKPLFGLTSQTDPNDKTIFYKYDDLGRLQTVRDDNGIIIKQYNYNYVKALNISPNQLTFNDICTNSVSDWRSVSLQNTVEESITFSVTLDDSNFQLDGDGDGAPDNSITVTLSPSESKDVYVRFSPTASQTANTNLNISLDNSSEQVIVPLYGNGISCAISATITDTDNGCYETKLNIDARGGSGNYTYNWTTPDTNAGIANTLGSECVYYLPNHENLSGSYNGYITCRVCDQDDPTNCADFSHGFQVDCD